MSRVAQGFSVNLKFPLKKKGTIRKLRILFLPDICLSPFLGCRSYHIIAVTSEPRRGHRPTHVLSCILCNQRLLPIWEEQREQPLRRCQCFESPSIHLAVTLAITPSRVTGAPLVIIDVRHSYKQTKIQQSGRGRVQYTVRD